MSAKSRTEMMEATRLKLLATGRRQFGSIGYANTAMDALTGKVGLTRGALYHHFGDKKGLFWAVYQQLDSELNARLSAVSARAEFNWQALEMCCNAFLEFALEEEIVRIYLSDAAGILDAEQLARSELACLHQFAKMLNVLMAEDIIGVSSPEVSARLLHGGLCETALWIAQSQDKQKALKEGQRTLSVWLTSLRI
ncbi:TetR/AcrR family transcriptional regulator [Thaumasiovibrio subtropicus]|uniref:TetR/AcrR family transcriptional regulator n=1 Tax=Thaumasiovibrio subtropicus TaxID=1891207 RepID=UPI000B35B1D0|nr:TetR/AcrR family transcriptional regulator [Thaumasiovibrio subtropicus]